MFVRGQISPADNANVAKGVGFGRWGMCGGRMDEE